MAKGWGGGHGGETRTVSDAREMKPVAVYGIEGIYFYSLRAAREKTANAEAHEYSSEQQGKSIRNQPERLISA